MFPWKPQNVCSYILQNGHPNNKIDNVNLVKKQN